MRLSHRDFDAFNRLLPELYACHDPQQVLERSLHLVQRLIACDHPAWAEMTMQPGIARLSGWVELTPRIGLQMMPRMEQAMLAHPFATHFATCRDPRAVRFSDFPRRVREAFQSEYADLNHDLEADHSLGTVPFFGGRGRFLGFGLARSRRDFSERDRIVLTALQPHLTRAYLNAQLFIRESERAGRLLSRLAETSGLTPREAEVAHWVSLGKTNRDVGLILGIGVRTVDKHMERLMKKLHVENRVAMAYWWQRLHEESSTSP